MPGGRVQIDMLHNDCVPTFGWQSKRFSVVPMLPTGNDNDDHLDWNWESDSPSGQVLQYDSNCFDPSRSRLNCPDWKKRLHSMVEELHCQLPTDSANLPLLSIQIVQFSRFSILLNLSICPNHLLCMADTNPFRFQFLPNSHWCIL